MANPIKAPKRPINQPIVFFQSIQAMRAAEQRLAEADSASQMNLSELGYIEAYACPADLNFIESSAHGFTGHDGRLYCSPDCVDAMYMLAEMTKEGQSND